MQSLQLYSSKQRENASESNNIVYHTGKKKLWSLQYVYMFLNSNNFTQLLGAN